MIALKMSLEEKQPFIIDNFSSGTQNQTSMVQMKEGEMLYTQNISFDRIGGLTKALGYTAVGNQIKDDKDILGLHGSEQLSKMFCAVLNPTDSKVDIYYNNAGTWTLALEDFSTVNEKVRFVTYLDRVYAISASTAQSTANGTTWATTNIASKVATTIASSQVRLWYANNTRTLYYSSLPDTGAITWGDYVDIATDTSEVIRAIRNLGRRLIVIMDKSVHSVVIGDAGDPMVDEISNTYGTVSHETAVRHGDYVYFFTRADGKYGIARTDGGGVQFISTSVQRYFDLIPEASIANIAMGAYGDKVYISVGSITLEDNTTITNAQFTFNVRTGSWDIGSTASKFVVYSTYRDATNGFKLYAGNNDGDIMMLESGYSQEGLSFNAIAETPLYRPGHPLRDKTFTRVRAIGEDLDNIRLQYRGSLKSDWKDIGMMSGNEFEIQFNYTGSGIQFRMMESSSNRSFMLEQLVVEYYETALR